MKLSRRLAIMDWHRKLVKAGKYEVAKRFLDLLMDGHVKLSLNDADWEAEEIMLEKIGLSYSCYGRIVPITEVRDYATKYSLRNITC